VEADGGFEEFVRSRSGVLVRFAYLLTGDRGIAEDLLQEVLAGLYLRWRRTDVPEAYARRALVNRSANHWRSRRRRPPETPLPDRFELAQPDESDRVLGDAAVLEVLRALPARQRAAVVLRYVEDLSEAETARLMRCSVGTVKSNAARGLARLREVVDATGGARSAVGVAGGRGRNHG
jgi:RNA polymerase sigma-70 factor (sigma-E family)